MPRLVALCERQIKAPRTFQSGSWALDPPQLGYGSALAPGIRYEGSARGLKGLSGLSSSFWNRRGPFMMLASNSSWPTIRRAKHMEKIVRLEACTNLQECEAPADLALRSLKIAREAGDFVLFSSTKWHRTVLFRASRFLFDPIRSCRRK